MICSYYNNKLIETKLKQNGNRQQRLNIVINDNAFEQYQILNTRDKFYRSTKVI
jgi:hypothetical protein